MKVDIIPNSKGLVHVFYLKSQRNSPKHYPKHPLIEGKIEFLGKLEFFDDLQFWFNFIFEDQNPKNAKGKTISVLVEFEPDNSTKFCLKGIGKKEEKAYLFFNKSMNSIPEENMAILNYELKKTKGTDSKLVKV